MWKILLYLTVFTAYVCGSGEFTVLHHPNSLLFRGHDQVEESDVTEVFSASLGFTIEHTSLWPAFCITDPFNVVEAVVEISVDGIIDLGGNKGQQFPLRTNMDDGVIFSVMNKRILEHNPDGNSLIVDTDLSTGLNDVEYEFLNGIQDILKPKVSLKFLKLGVEEDRIFIEQLNLLTAIANKIADGAIARDYQPDYYRIKFTALHALSDLHGENSTATKEAKQLLLDAILHLNDAFRQVYKGNVLVTIITSDASHTRRFRRATDTKDPKAPEVGDINLAKAYSSNYPVIFNIILWFGVALVFSLLAVSLVIGNMDPGRDSIIYRMTSTRMKKDN